MMRHILLFGIFTIAPALAQDAALGNGTVINNSTAQTYSNANGISQSEGNATNIPTTAISDTTSGNTATDTTTPDYSSGNGTSQSEGDTSNIISTPISDGTSGNATTETTGQAYSKSNDSSQTEGNTTEAIPSTPVTEITSPVQANSGATTDTWTNPSLPTQSASPATEATPPPFHIKPLNHTTKCLGIMNTNEADQDIAVVVRDCFDGDNEVLWQLQSTTLPTRIISWAFTDQPWCLDAGSDEDEEAIGPVVINKCDDKVPPGQVWQWTTDMHLVVHNQSRNVDLQDGIDIGGGYVQTWPYVFNNTNQVWILEPIPSAAAVDITQSQGG